MNPVTLDAINCLRQPVDDGDVLYLWYYPQTDQVILDLHMDVEIDGDKFPLGDRFKLPSWVMMQ